MAGGFIGPISARPDKTRPTSRARETCESTTSCRAGLSGTRKAGCSGRRGPRDRRDW